ncbi:uncharacterized protein LY89DRAFT_692348 [Mollisia scopiformis]|uniref:Uncharacterized protein n=1 Tax=Mollisia scopiformis TaxID=149040 RepID=A0A132B3Z5_MOLSC|nr:uncharacterized protein LY89DRAFT_692348 [Mollisia scopiformis]KUJ06749.1 hypothetical protein LY89DRAFT_692348 [Mollisia scopiformis]
MSRFWPHTPYAEEQPLSHTILWTHVLTRAVTAGSIVGTGVGISTVLLRNFNIIKQRIPPASLASTIVRSSGTGAVVATGLLCIALPIRMLGREEIEWQDRSWRLIENKGQVECDDWTYPGMTAGAVAFALRGQCLGWMGAVGSIGLGSVGGMMGYMGWRHGVKGGKFEETTV